ncbi:MAG TPA: alpha/beta hydrolase [Flavisolibacter sp.]|nr:alpha/beta hydrolase [Flavisolibacter sp.]
MLRSYTSVLVVTIALSCGSPIHLKANLPEEKKIDVPYGTFLSSKMDVYLPGNRNKHTPFVILIHGGAWTLGVKEWNREMQDFLLTKGIASANLNYRFADDNQVHFAQILADIDSAVNHCINHTVDWNIRKEGFLVSGTSAGGHLALLYAFTTNKKINGVIANCPPTDLADTALLNYEKKIGILPAIEKMAGAKYYLGQPLSQEFTNASPLYHVKNIPTLLIHGTADRTVPYSQSVKLNKELDSKKVPHKLFSLSGADHDLMLHDPKTKARLYNETMAWILKYGK